MIRTFTVGLTLWGAVGFLVLIGWDIYHATVVREDRWMLALVPVYVILSWVFFKAFHALRRNAKQGSAE